MGWGGPGNPHRSACPLMAWAWRAATATELKKQKPQAASCSAWCPGGRTTATPFKTWGRSREPRSDHCPNLFLSSCPCFSSSLFLILPLPAARGTQPHNPIPPTVLPSKQGLWGAGISSSSPFPQPLPYSLQATSLHPPGPPLGAGAPPQSRRTSPASTASTRRHVAPVASFAQVKVLGQM